MNGCRIDKCTTPQFFPTFSLSNTNYKYTLCNKKQKSISSSGKVCLMCCCAAVLLFMFICVIIFHWNCFFFGIRVWEGKIFNFKRADLNIVVTIYWLNPTLCHLSTYYYLKRASALSNSSLHFFITFFYYTLLILQPKASFFYLLLWCLYQFTPIYHWKYSSRHTFRK